ncbi:RNA-binding domain-containing protein [Crucibulum laeve]|uniref:RNA-binding domain-containing protein n=1 Tax=Crucibulum laeve TaxID=68775 RepID=A0A5C3MD11_9AGAR|nr:RNA-binding domain-containing protein [Crucibulum laeve]
MEEGTKSKKTVFVGGIGDEIDEAIIYENFSTFGDIIEVQLPSAATNPNQQTEAKHRGFAFVTYSSSADAQDAIDNMDLNELRGKVIKVSLARPMKTPMQLGGNRAIWESEEWLQQHVKPLAQSGGVQGRNASEAEPDNEDGDQVDEAMDE